jgi:hypothetical protein
VFGGFFDFSKNCQFQVFEKKIRNKEPACSGYLKTAESEELPVPGISKPSKDSHFS